MNYYTATQHGLVIERQAHDESDPDCPRCGSSNTECIDSDAEGMHDYDYITYECQDCKHLFETRDYL